MNEEVSFRIESMSFWEQKNNPIVNKSKVFALHIIDIYKYVISEKREFVLSKQVLRSGTSIGANIREAQRGQSKADFFAKMNIALKEADETEYWLELLHEKEYLEDGLFTNIYKECEELIRMLVKILRNNYTK